MYANRIATQLPAQLSDGLHERCTLDVADGTTHFGDDEVKSFVEPHSRRSVAYPWPFTEHAPLDLVGDVRHHLNGLAQIVAMAFAVDDGLVDATRGDAVVAGSMNARETFIVT